MKRFVWISIILIVSAGSLYYGLRHKRGRTALWQSPPAAAATFTVVRGDLEIPVETGGNLKAKDAQMLRGEVEGNPKIIYLIEEGVQVKPGDLLVTLDPSEISRKLSDQEITYSKAVAEATNASEALRIQLTKNESDLRKALQKVRSASLELQNYFGADMAEKLAAASVEADMEQVLAQCGGNALQDLRELEMDIDLAREDEQRAADKASWTKLLADQGAVTRNDLQADELALKRSRVALEKAQTALALFRAYEFRKKAEQNLSDYRESLQELNTAIAKAHSEQSQKEVDVMTSFARLETQQELLERNRVQLAKTTITAPQEGMVVYGSGNQGPMGGDEIKEGATARMGQVLITLPDMSVMQVLAKVHESAIRQVTLTQQARVRVDAFPDRIYSGSVTKVAVMPEAQNRWMNPDVNIYAVEITLENTSEDLKPGMSTSCEIIVAQLKEVVYVPLAFVFKAEGQNVCYVQEGGRTRMRPVKLGPFNSQFVVVSEGLEAGQRILMMQPEPGAPGREGGGAAGKKSDRSSKGNKSPPEKEEDAPPKNGAHS